MLGEEGEVKGEERAEVAVAGEAEEGTRGNEGEAGEEGVGGAYGRRARGGGAEDSGEGGGEGGAREVLGEDEGDVCEGAEPDERLLDLRETGQSVDELGARQEKRQLWEAHGRKRR